jgi:hypothetical protein
LGRRPWHLPFPACPNRSTGKTSLGVEINLAQKRSLTAAAQVQQAWQFIASFGKAWNTAMLAGFPLKVPTWNMAER